MIKITIEKTTTREYKETQNFVVKRTPTEQREKSRSYSYSGDIQETVVFIEENEPREVTKRETVTIKLLEQQIENEESFNLNRVIGAINGIGIVKDV